MHLLPTSAFAGLILCGCGADTQPSPEHPAPVAPADQPAAPQEQPAAPEPEESAASMRSCEDDDDCVIVRCSCRCSGCGGFSYEDVVNRAYEDDWYEEKGCTKATKCPKVCCPHGMSVVCRDGLCTVEE